MEAQYEQWVIKCISFQSYQFKSLYFSPPLQFDLDQAPLSSSPVAYLMSSFLFLLFFTKILKPHFFILFPLRTHLRCTFHILPPAILPQDHHHLPLYHCQPYDSLNFHYIPYFLYPIRKSDVVIYNPLSRDAQIRRVVVEIISSTATVCGGCHVLRVCCVASSAEAHLQSGQTQL